MGRSFIGGGHLLRVGIHCGWASIEEALFFLFWTYGFLFLLYVQIYGTLIRTFNCFWTYNFFFSIYVQIYGTLISTFNCFWTYNFLFSIYVQISVLYKPLPSDFLDILSFFIPICPKASKGAGFPINFFGQYRHFLFYMSNLVFKAQLTSTHVHSSHTEKFIQ